MPQAWLINPGGRRRRRRRHGRARARRTTHRRRRRRVAMFSNPAPRRRRRHRVHRARRRHSVRAFRNPAVFGIDVGKVGIGALAAVGSDLAGEWALTMLPAGMSANAKALAKYPVKLGLVAVTAMLVGRFFGRAAGAAAGIGGGVLVGVDAIREYVLPHVPVMHGGLSGVGLGWDDMMAMQGYPQPSLTGYPLPSVPMIPTVAGFARQFGT